VSAAPSDLWRYAVTWIEEGAPRACYFSTRLGASRYATFQCQRGFYPSVASL
jgi:hypothetical protein